MSIVDEVLKENELYSDGKVSYVKWLMSLVEDERVSAGQRLSYNKLLWRLWRIEYVPSFGNDDDRAIEGLELRNRYLSSLGENIGVYIHDDASNDVERMWGKCRVLEMLIALSTRMYDLMQDLGCGMAMDMDSGEMHLVYNSFDDFDNSNYSYNNDENDW